MADADRVAYTRQGNVLVTDLSRTEAPRRDTLRIGAPNLLQHQWILHAILTAEPGSLTNMPVLSSGLHSTVDNLEFYFIRTPGQEDYIFVRPFIGLGKVQGVHIVTTNAPGWVAVQSLFDGCYSLEPLERLTKQTEVQSADYQVYGDFSRVFERINHKATQLSERGSLSIVTFPRDTLYYSV